MQEIIFGQSTFKKLKTHLKVALLLILLITNIFVTAYYVDKPGDKYPFMAASGSMLSAEKYVIEGEQPKYVVKFPPFIYENFDFNKRFEMYYSPKRLSHIINDLAENKKPDQNVILFVNINQIKKYGRVDHGFGLIRESGLSKIYSNNEVNIYDGYGIRG